MLKMNAQTHESKLYTPYFHVRSKNRFQGFKHYPPAKLPRVHHGLERSANLFGSVAICSILTDGAKKTIAAKKCLS